jgi:hypothetical protein
LPTVRDGIGVQRQGQESADGDKVRAGDRGVTPVPTLSADAETGR